MANELATQKQQTGIATYLGGEAVKKNIAGVIGEKNTTRFISSVVSAVQANPQLAKCTNASILSAALQGEALQLAPSPQLGQFHMVGYKTKKKIGNQWVEVEEATFQLGWKGFVQLAIRSGQYRNIVVSEIKEGEADYNPITEEIDLHPITDPAVREAAKTAGYYAMFELVNGFRKQLFMSREAMESHARQYSRAYRYDLDNNKRSSVWSTNFDAMAKKTMIRQLIGKWGIMSVEMQQAYTNDMGVIDEDGTVRYVDNPRSVTIEAQVQEDIATNANSEEFIEEVPEVVPAPEPPKQTRAARSAAKKSAKETRPVEQPKPEPKQEPEPEVDPIPVDDDVEASMPEWGFD